MLSRGPGESVDQNDQYCRRMQITIQTKSLSFAELKRHDQLSGGGASVRQFRCGGNGVVSCAECVVLFRSGVFLVSVMSALNK